VRTELDTVDFFNMEHVLDVPFSAVADTLVLPYTIPRTLYIYAHPESRPCYEDWWNDVWLDHRNVADCHDSKR